jgi:hypothetical protein
MKTQGLPALASVDPLGRKDLADRAPGEIRATICAAMRRARVTVALKLCHSVPATGLTSGPSLRESRAARCACPTTATAHRPRPDGRR